MLTQVFAIKGLEVLFLFSFCLCSELPFLPFSLKIRFPLRSVEGAKFKDLKETKVGTVYLNLTVSLSLKLLTLRTTVPLIGDHPARIKSTNVAVLWHKRLWTAD